MKYTLSSARGVLDLRNRNDRQYVLRAIIQSRPSTSHSTDGGKTSHPEDLDLEALRLVCLRHRHAGATVRIDGFCRGCGTFGPSYIHAEYLLPYENGKYVGADKIMPLRWSNNATLPDGSRRVDMRALHIVATVLFPGGLP